MSSLPRLLILSSSSSVLMLRPAVAWLVGQPLAPTARHITTTESGSISASRGGTTSNTRRTSLSTATMLSSLSSRRTTIMASTFSTNTDGGSSSSSSATKSDDQSAMSRSRAPFRMPRNSPDDSVSSSTSTKDKLAWNQLGLWTELVDAVTRDMKLPVPTPVQNLVIPKLLQAPTPCDTAFLAATGSGKTLAYCLPLLQQLKTSEVFGSNSGNSKDESVETRKPKRPRLLIVAPTRELVTQITDVVKQLCHSIKLSSRALVGGQDYGKQRKALNRPIDVVVSTPGRLLQHWREGHVFLGDVQYVVLDEMDTLLEQGFQKELEQILYPILWERPMDPENPIPKEEAAKIILTSATMTQSIQKIIVDKSQLRNNNNNQDKTVTATKHYTKPGTEKAAKMILPRMEIIKAPGLHKAVPRLEQVFVDVGNIDKISLLVDVVSSDARKGVSGQQEHLTMVFCNTAASCRAVQFALAEARIDSLSYHGELNSLARSENLQRFRRAGQDPTSGEPRILVCTDLGARGLDVPQVDHVVMFDFPLNALDYLHRSGRTARGVADETTKGNGKVTALVAKRDKVLATAIENAVSKGEPIDGLSSRKSDYLPGGRLNRRGGESNSNSSSNSKRGGPRQQQRRGAHTQSISGGKKRLSSPQGRKGQLRP